MIENILGERYEEYPIANPHNEFNFDIDYQTIHSQALEEWNSLDKDSKRKYKHGLQSIINEKLKGYDKDHIKKAKAFSQVSKEIELRLEREYWLTNLPVISTMVPNALVELLEHLENSSKIKEIYKLRKPAVTGSGISESEAQKIKNCLRQGRELYIAGKQGGLMVKPLNFFYALTAYSYALTILNSPIRYALHTLPSSHGVQFIRSEASIKFAGDITRGTFNELIFSFPAILTKSNRFEFTQTNIETLKTYFNKTIKISIGMLLSMIPELRDFYNLLSGKISRTYPVSIDHDHSTRVQKLEFRIGDGTSLPSIDSIKSAFGDREIKNKFGQFIVSLEAAELTNINAMIWSDEYGELWFVDNPLYPLNLPEIAIHFLIISSLSTVMRYDPQLWGEIVLNEVNSNVSLIIRKYLSILEYKMPFLILRNGSSFWPYLKQ